jgi:hypothetical protein
MSVVPNSGRRLPEKLTEEWVSTRDKGSNAERDGSTFSLPT